jgi:glutamine synthetase
MAHLRKKAVQDVLDRVPNHSNSIDKISTIYGEAVFHQEVMREYLPEEAFKSIMGASANGIKIEE